MALCFEVRINQEDLVVAGSEAISVLSALITFVSSRNELEVRVGGLISRSRHDKEHLDWLQRDLKPGDEVLIRIVETSQPSPPTRREREDPEFSEQQERKYYEALKKRYESE